MAELLNLREYEQFARVLLPKMVHDYYAGGAADEITVRENEKAWTRIRLRPRVLVDVSACDLSTSNLGQPVSMPLMIAPAALNALAHPEGELAVARAAAAAGIVQVVSTLSSYRLEDVAAASDGKRWFQLYCYRDRAITQELVERAEAAGFAALCLTVDAPVPGDRERDAHDHFKVPANIRVANLAHLVPDASDGSALLKYVSEQFDPSLTWEAVDWLRGITRLPIVLKGILTPQDAKVAVEHGAAGIGVSNHGGRQLDTVLTTCEALPQIVEAVAGKAEVFVDGGIRRGTDLLKAIALGARAVMIGRPYLWGLTVDGEAGVRRVLKLLHDDLRVSMALAGCQKISDISGALVSPAA